MNTAKRHLQYRFGSFRFDGESEQLWQNQQAVALKPKAFTVLRYLLTHAGQLVTKTELFDAIWPDTVVTDGVLKFCIKELRHALGDDAKAPQFIETVHRRGYRWIAPLDLCKVPGFRSKVYESQFPIPNPHPLTPSFVGREEELEQLNNCLEKALGGKRQLVFITGEPGIGKTGLVEAFCDRVRATTQLLVGLGQCVEQYGVGEAYRPVIEAIGRLCLQPDGRQFIALLHTYAPSWVGQLPALASEADRTALQLRDLGATRGRMLREMVDMLDALTSQQPLILILEDLHWSDASTLELLSVLARRHESARLLVIGTSRSVDALVAEHPLRRVQQELQLHDLCNELRLGYLSKREIYTYLATRFPEQDNTDELAALICQRTEGSPLFMVNIVNALVRHAGGSQKEEAAAITAIVVRGRDIPGMPVPDNLQRFIEQQLAQRTNTEQAVLEAASAVGVEFAAAAVSAAIEHRADTIEEVCERLAKREQFLHVIGLAEWPDGTLSTHYRFIHTLYQEVLYERIAPGRRIRLHQRIGKRLAAAYREQATTIAAELALHFEQGRERQRAADYHHQAGRNALRRHGYQEAIRHLRRGLELLRTLPQTRECIQQQIVFHLALGLPLVATKGNAAPEVETNYAQAKALCQHLDNSDYHFPVLGGLVGVHCLRAELQSAHELGQQLLQFAKQKHDPAWLIEVHLVLGSIRLWLGDPLSGRTHLEQGIAFYDRQAHHPHPFVYGPNSGVASYANLSYALWLLGYPDQARHKSQEALALARRLSHPYSLGYALNWEAMLHQFRLEEPDTQIWAKDALTLARTHGFTHLFDVVSVLSGWALVTRSETGETEEGMERLQAGLSSAQKRQAILMQPYSYTLLAQAFGKTGRPEKGLTCVKKGLTLAYETGERWWEAELYRVQGTLLLAGEGRERNKKSQKSKGKSQMSKIKMAEECFRQAVEVARSQRAKSLELRAVMCLSRVWDRQGRRTEARRMLEECYEWFTEGFDTPDLQEAQGLLQEWS